MDKSYQELFFGESQEYLKEINKTLVRLETDPQDNEAINIIFRLMHTLKGMAATMEYRELAEFAHCIEDVFDAFRAGKLRNSPETMDVIFESIDAFTTVIDDIKEERGPSVEIPLYLNKLRKFISKEKAEEKKIEPIKKEEIKIDSDFIEEFKKSKENILRIEINLVKDCLMKGVRAFLILNRANNLGTVINASPNEEALKEEEFEFGFEFMLLTSEKQETIKTELLKILEVEKIEISALDATSLEKLPAKAKTSPAYLKKIHSVRIPAERLDRIMNLTGELVITKNRLLQTLQTKDYACLQEAAYIIEKLVSSLQDEALKTRLLPISYILDNFPRIVRDLARKENKEVDLEINGGDIELDRIILDEIGDLLVQLIRNALDHGIEPPALRAQAGKNPHGKISINIYRDKGNITIEISDDGKGVDYDKIIKLAQDKGLITAEEALHVDSDKILDILSMPGFSTKDKVTSVSGRGVGLDVVKNKLDILGGRLELESHSQKEAKFILTLPLTLAIIKAMLVLVGEEMYALPLMNIRETIKIKNENIKPVGDIELIQLRNEVVPLLRLDKELGIESRKGEAKEIPVVIIESRLKSMGLVVDKVVSEQDIVVKPLGPFIKKIKGITGATILADGKVAFILDALNLK